MSNSVRLDTITSKVKESSHQTFIDENGVEHWIKVPDSGSRFRYASLTSILLAAVTLTAATLGLYQSFSVSRSKARQEQIEAEVYAARSMREVESMRVAQKQTQALLDNLAAKLAARPGSGEAKGQGQSDDERRALEALTDGQKHISERLSALEGALMNDPVKALSLPLMKKDLDALQDRTKADSDALRGELGRLYSFAQWFMGLIITAALSLISLGVANFRKSSKMDAGATGKNEPSAVMKQNA